MLAALVGAPLGASIGILAGSFIIEKFISRPASPYLLRCDRSADDNPDIPMPDTANQPVSFWEKTLLKDTSPALIQPDYERALFINKILKLLWPHLSPAIHKEVMKQAKAPIGDALASIPLVKDIRIDKLDLGERPFRVDSFKTYETVDDEIIMETSLFWGGDLELRVTAVVQAGPMTVDLPIDVQNIQFKALARITIPLVETLPCAGGVTISLLEEPFVDFELNVLGSPDIMAMPGVPLAVRSAIKVIAGNMLVYPNEFMYPLMEGFGRPPPPQGMLKVCVKSGHNLKSSFFDVVDPYVVLEIRTGRPSETSFIKNNPNPVWNEDIDLVVDDPVVQELKIVVMDEDVLLPDIVGGTRVELKNSDFISKPRVPITLRLPVYEPSTDGEFPIAKADDLALAAATAATDAVIYGAAAALPKKKGVMGKIFKKKAPKLDLAGNQIGTGTVTPLYPGESAASSMATTPRMMASPRSEVVTGRESSFTAALLKKMPFHHSEGGAGASSTPPTTTAPITGAIPEGEEAKETPSSERQRRAPGTVTGSVTLEVTYFPFFAAAAPHAPGDIEGAAGALQATGDTTDQLAPAGSSTAVMPALRRTLQSQTFSRIREQKGVLTVTLNRVKGLGEQTDSYVHLRLYDPFRLPVPDMEAKTRVEMNEASPKFNFKTDFVNISAASVLTLTVFAQKGTMAALTSLKVPFLQKAKAEVLGKVRIPLEDVVREGRVNDVFALQEAQTGEMYLNLEWSSVDLAGGVQEAAAAAVLKVDSSRSS